MVYTTVAQMVAWSKRLLLLSPSPATSSSTLCHRLLLVYMVPWRAR
jgi:hypothetical protein